MVSFPEIRDKPVILNLWSLTGVGKSSLVKRLSDLIEFDKSCFRFDLGDTSENAYNIRNKLDTFFEWEAKGSFPFRKHLHSVKLLRKLTETPTRKQ